MPDQTYLSRRREKTSAITSQPPNPNAGIVRLRVHSENARSKATDIGMPTVTSHGPPEAIASPYMRRTPSTLSRASVVRVSASKARLEHQADVPLRVQASS